MLEGMRTLRGSLSAVILLGALVPSLLIASYLIERFRSASEASTMAALEKNATLLTLDVKRDYELLLAAAEQLSSDPDVIYSAYTGAFGAKANIKLARFTQLHPSVFGAMVVDSLAWPVEATPTTLGLLDMAPMTPLLTDFFNDSKQAKIQINDIENASLLSDIYNIQHKDVEDVKELRSDHLFMVMSPLWLSAVDKAELHELVGAMVVLLPVHTLIEEAQKRLLHGDGLDIVILDLMMDNQSLIRPESKLAEVNDYIVIDVPMRVSQSTDTIVWTLGVERAAALQTIDDLQLELWLIVVGLILVLSVVAFWLARYVVNPINSVNKLVASYAGADYSKRSLKLPFRELQQMANVLEQMAQRIVEDQHKLEQRVLNRTYELQNANNELNHTMHQLKATQAQLVEVEKMSLLGQLVAGIAHEINTPVGVAVTAATMLEQQVIELD
ncbi:hypothetical protein K0504_10510 [Neiella marina]|uniref:histidine kinase n=1 Tax=Neiella holothuriorum TaxID=2870530 RepID=A0ABS7EHU4_9GAMM|nr:hypothetical protein [Neiella holothuriorum]MBW8191468.1 hypothetical protein [Neiella holothuriorum]